MVKCLSCGGTYEPIQADGTTYFHACPPLAVHEIRRGLGDGTVQLPRATLQRLRAAENSDAQAPPPAGELSQVDQVLGALVIERPERRDENVVPTSDRERSGRRMKAEGRGIEDVPAP